MCGVSSEGPVPLSLVARLKQLAVCFTYVISFAQFPSKFSVIQFVATNVNLNMDLFAVSR